MSFFVSKFFWILINPFSLFIYLFVISFFLLILKKYRISKIVFFFSLLYILFISIFPIGKIAFYVLEKEFYEKIIYPKDIHGILILGGAIDPFLSNKHNSVEFNESAERMIESIYLINKYKKAKIIFSGGSGYLNKPSLDHAKIAKIFYKNMNIDISRIHFENKSRNTFENIIFSKKFADPVNNKNWLLITSASHMRRSLLISEKINWKLFPYAVDFKQSKDTSFYPSLSFFSNFNSFQRASHEWLGLISYYMMGRTERIF